MKRIRITYAKGDQLRFTGNLDMHKVWERTFRRAGIRLAYSQGFHPQPKIQQACPLPLGFTSLCELLDFWSDEETDTTQLKEKLSDTLQPGIDILEIEQVSLTTPPLQTQVTSADYLVTIVNHEFAKSLDLKIARFLDLPECIRERRGKKYDLRSLVEKLSTLPDKNNTFFVRLTTLPGATGRPEELLEEFNIPLAECLIERSALNFSQSS
jgi:radical SAM-linked protein